MHISFSPTSSDSTQKIELSPTDSITLSLDLAIPSKRPEYGIISLLGVFTGAVGKGRLLYGLTIGRDNQLRLEAGETQKRGPKVSFPSSIHVSLQWTRGTLKVTALGQTFGMDTASQELQEGRLILGQEMPKPGHQEYGPPLGFTLTGTLEEAEGEDDGGNDPPELLPIEAQLQAIEGAIEAIRSLTTP